MSHKKAKFKLFPHNFLVILLIVIYGTIGYIILKPSQASNVDFNNDGKVDIYDLSILLSNYGKTGRTFAQGDTDGNGMIDFNDLNTLLSNWGGGGTSGYQRPFGSTAPWNIPVAGLPVSPDSANLVAHIWDASPKAELHIYDNGYTFAVFDAAQATVTAKVVSTVYQANITTIPWNPNWQGPAGTDSQVTVIDQVTGREWDLWQVSPNSTTAGDHGYNASTNTLTVSNAHICTGDYRTATASTCPNSRGAGLNYLALLIRPQEIQQGHIDHALAFPIDAVNSSFVAPAVRSDAGGGYVPMGTRIAIHATDTEIANFVATLPFNSIGKNSATIILKAIRDYGMIVTDNGGQATTQLEDIASAGTAWANLGIDGNWTWPAPFVTQSRMYAIVPSNQYP